MLEDVGDIIRLFWIFNSSSIVNIFSSENKTLTRPWFASRLRRILLLDTLFSSIALKVMDSISFERFKA